MKISSEKVKMSKSLSEKEIEYHHKIKTLEEEMAVQTPSND